MNKNCTFEIINVTQALAGLMYPVLGFLTGGYASQNKRNGKIKLAEDWSLNICTFDCVKAYQVDN